MEAAFLSRKGWRRYCKLFRCVFSIYIIGIVIGTIQLTSADMLEHLTNQKYFQDIDAEEPEVSLRSSEQQHIDWAYSPIGLMQLAKFEEELYSKFSSKSMNQKLFFEIAPKDAELQEFQWWWLSDYESTSLNSTRHLPASKNIGSIFTHPFLTFRMIKRFSSLTDLLKRRRDIFVIPDLHAVNIPHGQKALKLIPDFFQKVKSFDAKISLPVYRDLRNLFKSILTLRYHYDLNVDQLVKGKFGEISTNFGISLEEAFEMGYFAYKLEMFSESMEWLQAVFDYSATMKTKSNFLSTTSVFDLIIEVTKRHDALVEKIESGESLGLDTYHRFTAKITSGQTLITRRDADRAEFIKSKDKLNHSNPLPGYELLCAGQDFVPEAQRVNLSCWYERRMDPAWLINPLKIEVHSWDPFVVQIYDVVSNKLMDYLLSAAIPNMERATAIPNKSRATGRDEAFKYQTSTSTSLLEEDKEDRKVLEPLNQRIGRMTQLSPNPIDPKLTATEPWQIAAYAFGGESKLHFDALAGTEAVDFRGYRVATFMIYLNNVRRGGYTAFPKLGISIVPKKGSALFWHNLKSDGDIDSRTLHGGCPVILGEKWIATKFIRQRPRY